jgi:hypothetical protein
MSRNVRGDGRPRERARCPGERQETCRQSDAYRCPHPLLRRCRLDSITIIVQLQQPLSAGEFSIFELFRSPYLLSAQYRGANGNPDNCISFKALLGDPFLKLEPDGGTRTASRAGRSTTTARRRSMSRARTRSTIPARSSPISAPTMVHSARRMAVRRPLARGRHDDLCRFAEGVGSRAGVAD